MHVHASGAVAAVVYNSVGSPFAMASKGTEITIPAVMISNADGLALKSVASSASGTRVRIPVVVSGDPFAWSHINLASFSSKGPVNGDLRIKPDLVCPVRRR